MDKDFAPKMGASWVGLLGIGRGPRANRRSAATGRPVELFEDSGEVYRWERASVIGAPKAHWARRVDAPIRGRPKKGNKRDRPAQYGNSEREAAGNYYTEMRRDPFLSWRGSGASVGRKGRRLLLSDQAMGGDRLMAPMRKCDRRAGVAKGEALRQALSIEATRDGGAMSSQSTSGRREKGRGQGVFHNARRGSRR